MSVKSKMDKQRRLALKERMVTMKDMKELIFSHGLDYCSNFDLLYKLQVRRVLAINEHPEWTLSCSREDQPLGNFGFYCTGTVVDLYDRDCFSIRTKDGGRKPASDCEQYRCSVNEWLVSNRPTEAFVKDVKILKFWMKEEGIKKYSQNPYMEEIGKLDVLNIPIEVI